MIGRLDIELLEAFVAVVNTGSFTQAGESLHRSQPNISMQIKRLEERVGKPLIQRQSKSFELTGNGQALFSYANHIVSLSKEATERLSAPELSGVARIGIPEWLASSVLCDFARVHPKIKLEIHVGDSAMLKSALKNGDLDLILAIRNPADISTARVWKEPLYWVAGKDYTVPSPVPLALFVEPCPYREIAKSVLDGQQATWKEVFTSTSVAAVRVALESGLGVSVLPAGAITPALRVLTPEEGFPDLPPTELAIYTFDKKMPQMIEFLNKYLAEHVGAAILNN